MLFQAIARQPLEQWPLADELTADIVRIAYRLFLGRDAESDRVVQDALSYGTLARLRAAFLDSAEFRAGPASRPLLVPIDAPPLDIEWEPDATTAAAMLAHVRQTWTRLGTERPHWSVLSHEEFVPERIAETGASFFASGAKDCQEVIAVLRRHAMVAADCRSVFEFGCGLGRVTAHLARHFDRVTACDVSRSHLRHAAELIGQQNLANVEFRLVESDAFGMEAPFDLWFSRLVLQHNPPPLMVLILRRALSLLAPGGVAMFQLPTHATGYRFRIVDYLRGLQGDGRIEMHVLPQPAVFELLDEQSCEPLEVLEDLSAGPSAAWSSTMFVARKRGR